MSDYSKITNFLSKDSLALNDPAKYVKGSEIDAEYNAIAAAIATKADTASPTLTTPTMSSPTITGTITAAIANFSGLVTAALGLTVTGAAFNSRGITDSATAKALTLSGSGANSVTIANSAANPTIGVSGGSLALSSVINYIGTGSTDFFALYGGLGAATIQGTGASADIALQVISKGAGSITLAAGALTQVAVLATASANRYITLTGSNGGNPTIGTSGGNLALAAAVIIGTNSTDYLQMYGGTGVTTFQSLGGSANVGINFQTKGTGGFSFYTGTAPAAQVFISDTASANRYITLTGSNGGNPTIGTSAGGLAISSALVGASTISAHAATATTAGGNSTAGIQMGSGNLGVFWGSGAPTISANKGSIYLRSDGSATNDRMYVATDAVGTWTAVTTAA